MSFKKFPKCVLCVTVRYEWWKKKHKTCVCSVYALTHQMKEWRNKYCYSWQNLHSIFLLRLFLQDGFYVWLDFVFLLLFSLIFFSFIHSFQFEWRFCNWKISYEGLRYVCYIVYAAYEQNERSWREEKKNVSDRSSTIWFDHCRLPCSCVDSSHSGILVLHTHTHIEHGPYDSTGSISVFSLHALIFFWKKSNMRKGRKMRKK